MATTLRSQRNSKKQGDVGLGVAIGWFVKNDYPVSIPLTDSQDYDLVIEEPDGRLAKVQVKTTYHQSAYGIYKANLKVAGGNRSGTGKIKRFDPTKIDYLFVVTEVWDMFFIPAEAVKSSLQISLGDKCEEYRVY
jgi:hypothetical protein